MDIEDDINNTKMEILFQWNGETSAQGYPSPAGLTT
jgi:hypothetical protein